MARDNKYNKTPIVEGEEVETAEVIQQLPEDEVLPEEDGIGAEVVETQYNTETPEEVIEQESDKGGMPETEQPVQEDEKQPETIIDKLAKPQVVETPVIVDMMNVDAIAELLTQPGMTIHDKLVNISRNGVPTISKVASKLIDYNTELNPAQPARDTKFLANKNYDLYNTIKSVIETPDYATFKLRFDIVNLAFKAFGKEAFNEYLLRRGVESWTWGTKSFNTYTSIVSAVAILCDLSTRSKNVSKIDFKKLLNDSTINELGRENIKKYYDQ